jgi:hypothetical protein
MRASEQGRQASKEASTSFFEKKEAKKLLLLWAMGVSQARAKTNKSFLVLFFKKELLSFYFPCLAFDKIFTAYFAV